MKLDVYAKATVGFMLIAALFFAMLVYLACRDQRRDERQQRDCVETGGRVIQTHGGKYTSWVCVPRGGGTR